MIIAIEGIVLCALFTLPVWFCHDKHFVIKGTEDMVKDYHDYWFHIKGFFIGEVLALAVCALSGVIVQFVL